MGQVKSFRVETRVRLHMLSPGLPPLLIESLAAPDHLCLLEVDTTGAVEDVSWYDIWAAVVAVNGMCVRKGKTGKATGLGELSRCD